MPKKKAENRAGHPERIRRIHARIAEIGYLCSGTIYERTKVCGKAGCACADDPSARHGPYFVWSRREAGRLVQSNLTAEQARLFSRAIRNRRRLQAILKRWEKESVRLINLQTDASSKKRRG